MLCLKGGKSGEYLLVRSDVKDALGVNVWKMGGVRCQMSWQVGQAGCLGGWAVGEAL